MRSNYKKIGLYVRQANQRNKDMAVTNLRGININKLFMPSVANTVGVDLSKYKVVSKHQFAFNPMHVGRDEMLPISMLDKDDPVIVSPAYMVFEIKDHKELDPEYLMMWCRRPEFDRNAWFTTDSSVRGGFSWSDFCDMELPVPSIEKQREIVREYNTIVNRIQLNEQMNQKLEETAQAIYKHWFVDFEFPISAEYAASIGKPELEGKPYKSSGGEMVFCAELDQEIPKGWGYDVVLSVSKKIICGKTPSTTDSDNFGNEIPFITIPDMHDKVFVTKTGRSLSDKGAFSQKNQMLPPKSICVSCIASAGIVVLTSAKSQTNQQINSVIPKDNISPYWLYFVLKLLGPKIKEWGMKGSIGANLSKAEFSNIKIVIPDADSVSKFHRFIEPFFETLLKKQLELHSGIELKNLVNSGMVKAA